MQKALEVLPGERLQFIAGQAFVVDHRDHRLNTRVVLEVLRTAGLIVMPTAREDQGWEDWFPAWIAECHAGQKPLLAQVIMPDHTPVPNPNPPGPGDVTYRFRQSEPELIVMPLQTNQDVVEAERVAAVESWAEPFVADEAPAVKPISWDDVLDEATAAIATPAAAPKKKGHPEDCQCNFGPCIKRRRIALAGA